MLNIQDILKSKQIENPKLEKSERSQIIKEMYEIYTHPGERVLRRKENWKRYCTWFKETKQKENSTKVQELFRKEKRFIREQPIKTFVFFLLVSPCFKASWIIACNSERISDGSTILLLLTIVFNVEIPIIESKAPGTPWPVQSPTAKSSFFPTLLAQ